MKSIVFYLDDEDFDKLLKDKEQEALKVHKRLMSWREYFMLCSELEFGR